MRRSLDVRRFVLSLAICGAVLAATPARATPALTMDVSTGDVLYQQDATQPWFPASTTKLMTVYVALSAVRDHQITMETPLVVSARAHKMPPSKMGFPVGTQVTLGNALKMLMVRSANDLAITVAEGIGGSVEAFADDMNQSAAQLGMRESHFVNPNGLPDPNHVSSARDMAILARALYTQFPQYAELFNLGALSLGREIIVNHNNLLGRYPGADGMKTGFTCAAGFNVVASAYRDGRRLVVVVFGAPSVAARTAKVAALFDRGFANVDRPINSIVALPTTGIGAPDMRDQVCRARGGLIAKFNGEVEQLDAALDAPPSGGLGLSALNPERSFLFNTTNVVQTAPMATRINTMPAPVYDPVPVRIGADPGYTGVVAEARAPHSPIGSESQPIAAEAYAAAPAGQPLQNIAGTPLAVDVNALPLRGRRIKAFRARKAHMNAAAEAPKTKVLAGAEGSDEPKTAKAKPAPGKSKTARKPAKKQAIGDSDDGVKANKKVAATKAVSKAAAARTSTKSKAASRE